MTDIPKENSDHGKKNMYLLLETAVPLFSFGGAALAVLCDMQGIPLDFRIPALGCVISSCALTYLAWIRPRKDIVALTTPIYSVIFFIAPAEYAVAILLQLLYAVSLTLLLVRLKYRFGEPGTAESLGKELGGEVKAYIERTRDAFSSTGPEAAHQATVAFVRFAEGNYRDAALACQAAITCGNDTENERPLVRAFGIIREHAVVLDRGLPRPVTYQTFPGTDIPLLAKPAGPARDDDAEFEHALDNALLVVYSAAWNRSEKDRLHLLACQAFAKKLMEG